MISIQEYRAKLKQQRIQTSLPVVSKLSISSITILIQTLMIRIEVYCMLALLADFVVSMPASLSHADIDSVYSLFAFYVLLTHRHYNSIRQILIILIAVTALILISDFWVLANMQYQTTSSLNKTFGYFCTAVEICLKIGLEVAFVSWRVYIKQADKKRPMGAKGTFNSELGY